MAGAAQSTPSAHGPKTEGGANLIEPWRLTSRGASLSRAVPVTRWRWTTDSPLRKKLLENKAANNFARPAVAGATSPTHRAQPPGGDIDVAYRRGVGALDGCADSLVKALILLELPLSKFE